MFEKAANHRLHMLQDPVFLAARISQHSFFIGLGAPLSTLTPAEINDFEMNE